jgi:hypothetical protein
MMMTKQEVFTFLDGTKYVGEVKDGTMDGQGTLEFPSGERYVGEFRNGERDGQGALYDSKGKVIFQGTFKNGMPEPGPRKRFRIISRRV